MDHCPNRVPSLFTAKGLCPFQNPLNIVLEQPCAKNGSLFIPRPTKWGQGVLALPWMSVRPSGICIFVSRAEQNSVTRA